MRGAGSRPPRVLIASRLFAPEVAAASARLSRLARALVGAGCAVEVVTTRPPAQAGPVSDPAGVRVSRWPVLRDHNGNIRGYVQYLSFDLPLLLRLLRRRAPDVVVCEPPPTTGLVVLATSRLRRHPYVYYAADIWSEASESAGAPAWVVRLLRRAESAVLRGAREVLAVSDGVAERLEGLGVDGSRVHVVGNGVDTDVFGRTAAGSAVPVLPAGPYAVYAGTMSEWQGADVFVRGFALALDRLPADARLVFLGQGSDLPMLKRLASEIAPGRVDFPGVLPPSRPPTGNGGRAARWCRSCPAVATTSPSRRRSMRRPRGGPRSSSPEWAPVRRWSARTGWVRPSTTTLGPWRRRRQGADVGAGRGHPTAARAVDPRARQPGAGGLPGRGRVLVAAGRARQPSAAA